MNSSRTSSSIRNLLTCGVVLAVLLSGTQATQAATVTGAHPQQTSLPPTNMAQSKLATQSTTDFGGDPGRGVDGNTDGTYGAASVTHTRFETNPWWQVDLGADNAISTVVLWNRTDCCAERLSNFYVFVSSTDLAGRSLDSILSDAAVWRTQTPNQAPTSLSLPVGATGRYVRVQLAGSNYLQLAEVQVFGDIAAVASVVTESAITSPSPVAEPVVPIAEANSTLASTPATSASASTSTSTSASTSTAATTSVVVSDDPQLISIKTIANPRSIGSWGGSTKTEANPRSIGSWGGPNSDGYRKNQQAFVSLGVDRVAGFATGEGIVVAVLDTGFQLDHPMLAGSFTNVRYDFVDRDADPTDVKDGLDNDGNRLVDEAYGHGTHVTGIIRLIAPNAKIMPLRVLNAEGDGNMANLVAAIDFAVQNGAKVINLSLGATKDNAQLQAAVQRAYARGVLVIAAAGNLDLWPKQYPAANSCAVAVTSSGQAQNFINKLTNGMATWIDFAAPGENIYSTFPGSTYATWSGSSMATPIVSASAALVWSRYPNASPKQVMQLMNATSDVVKAGFLLGLITGLTYEDVSRINQFVVTFDGNFLLPYIRRSPDVGNSMQNGDNYFNGRYSSSLKRGGALSDCP